MPEKEPPKEYPPRASADLERHCIGREKHSPYDLYMYVWSRLMNLNSQEEVALGNLLRNLDNVQVREIIESIIDRENKQGKEAAMPLLEVFRDDHIKARSENVPGIDPDKPKA